PYTELVALTSTANQDLVVLGVAIPAGGGSGGGQPTAVPFGVNPLPGLAIVGLFGWRRLRKRLNRDTPEQAA
ncbi:MAG: PFE-CTERM domain-containing protein, partial [Puniceicoccales bacterium]